MVISNLWLEDAQGSTMLKNQYNTRLTDQQKAARVRAAFERIADYNQTRRALEKNWGPFCPCCNGRGYNARLGVDLFDRRVVIETPCWYCS